MKFVLVFITMQMAQGGANLGPMLNAPRFNTARQCQAALQKLPPAPNHKIGWQCVPQLP